MNFEIPQDIADFLVKIDDFIETTIKPLEEQDDNIRFFDHRREDARTDWHRDGLPNVLMEAQSQKLPCISTRVSGVPELVEHGTTGLLVGQQDPVATTAQRRQRCDVIPVDDGRPVDADESGCRQRRFQRLNRTPVEISLSGSKDLHVIPRGPNMRDLRNGDRSMHTAVLDRDGFSFRACRVGDPAFKGALYVELRPQGENECEVERTTGPLAKGQLAEAVTPLSERNGIDADDAEDRY